MNINLMKDTDRSLSKYHRCLTETDHPTLRGFSPYQGDMASLNFSLKPQNPLHNTGFGFAGNPLLGTGLTAIPTRSSQAPINLLAYRPQNLNVNANTLHLPGSKEGIILDPRYTSLSKLKRFNKKIDRVQRKMKHKLMSLMGQRQTSHNPYKNQIDNIVKGYSDRISAYQDHMLQKALKNVTPPPVSD